MYTHTCAVFSVRNDDKSVPLVQHAITVSDLMIIMVLVSHRPPPLTNNPYH